MASVPNANCAPQRLVSSTVPAGSHLVSRSGIAFALVSVLLLVPCFWHAHIQAGDLGSHVYNAWLAELAQQGKAPGVYVVWQWNNVLFDLLLFYSAKAFGFLAAERIAVSISVLVFFWGIFALLRVIGGKSPWFIAPFIAMLTYGYIFHMGFMNYHLSLGLACLGLSFAWPLRRNGLIVAVLLCPLMLLAHPLGFLWFLGTIAYRFLWLYFRGRWELLLAIGALLPFFVAHLVVSHHASAWQVEWRNTPVWRLNGADQFHVFGPRYHWLTVIISVFIVLATAIAWLQDTRFVGFWKDRRLLFELYFISFLGTALLPENLLPNPTGGWIGALVTRLTLISAILVLCWLASLPPRSWHLAISAACGIVFFIFIYQDTAFLNRMEASADRVTQQLPFGTRAAATIFAPEDWRIIYLHIPDRACIGHCFLVSNYEPSTGQFRVRVHPGSPVVTASVDDSEDMQSGIYDVQEEDLPLKQIYQCQRNDLSQICIRDLAEDEKNDRLGYHPPNNPFFSENP
jgi:hypothetical protein